MTNNIFEKFELVSTDDLKEYQATGLLYRHKKTGCEIYHVKNDDKENLFSFVFLTPPEDSLGTAHIMEHSVLSGSGRFPVKDPFVQLMKSSVNTFLNAITYPDRTAYPASSTVPKDYFNIMEVYGDAVFFPLLRKETFMQEGTIVYNEMKGAYSEQGSVCARLITRSILPDTPFVNESGGNPAEIHKLSYEDFVAFHKKYYHPSNCRIFLYGNIDTERQLDFLESHFLCRFDMGTKVQPALKQWKKSFQGTFNAFCPAGENPSPKGTISINWLCEDITNPVNLVKLDIMESILMKDSTSHLIRRMEESEIWDDLADTSGISVTGSQGIFSVGVRVSDKNMAPEFQKFIIAQLEEISRLDFDDELILGLFHHLDFLHREVNVKFGLSLMERIMPGWIYNNSVTSSLCIKEALEQVKKEYAADKKIFNKMICSQLLDNHHSSITTVFPGDVPETQPPEKDQAVFDAYQAKEDSPEDLAEIPFLTRDDIPSTSPPLDIVREKHGGNRWYKYKKYTGGIVYLNVLYQFPFLDKDSLVLLPFMEEILSEAEIDGMPSYKVKSALDLITKNMRIDATVLWGEIKKPFINVKFTAFQEKVLDGWKFVHRLVEKGDISNRPHVKLIVTRIKNMAESALEDGGYQTAFGELNSMLGENAALKSVLSGFDSMLFWKNVNPDDENFITDLLEKTEKFRSAFLKMPKIVSLCCDTSYDTKELELLVDSADMTDENVKEYGHLPEAHEKKNEVITFGTTVNYIAMGVNIPGMTMEKLVKYNVLCDIMSNGCLWNKVRMNAGAYGVNSIVNYKDQTIIFISYRDPEFSKTFAAYIEAVKFMADGNLDSTLLETTVIKIIGEKCKPYPNSEFFSSEIVAEINGFSYEVRKNNEEILLKLTVNDIIETARELLPLMEKAVMVSVAGKASIEKEREFLHKNNFSEISLSI